MKTGNTGPKLTSNPNLCSDQVSYEVVWFRICLFSSCPRLVRWQIPVREVDFDYALIGLLQLHWAVTEGGAVSDLLAFLLSRRSTNCIYTIVGLRVHPPAGTNQQIKSLCWLLVQRVGQRRQIKTLVWTWRYKATHEKHVITPDSTASLYSVVSGESLTCAVELAGMCSSTGCWRGWGWWWCRTWGFWAGTSACCCPGAATWPPSHR